ncbi:hypothetical protein P7K49_023141 [Saguinus oedipus]|uniref:Uncharacterized protein n=1 Tax=Saguinus oedipus TaxID=9490 RepID=A0ABQ9ULP3_SAGOE|nr:hypothetical protein P7K49_023141 [Saguinus oedipus]
MLAENLVEEFEMKEDEPWYDHQDLQQGGPRCGTVPGRARAHLAAEPVVLADPARSKPRRGAHGPANAQFNIDPGALSGRTREAAPSQPVEPSAFYGQRGGPAAAGGGGFAASGSCVLRT